MTTKTWTRAGVLAIAGVAAVLSACDSAPGSCTTGNTCIDYENGYTSSEAMSACTSSNGYATTPCPITSRVGRCTVTVASIGTSTTYVKNYYAPMNTSGAMADCATLGMGGGTVATFAAN